MNVVQSENDINKMTKQKLKQWLTRHDQRLPADDRRKPYYLERAMSYFRLLQKEQAENKSNTKPSRSKIKMKGQIVSNSRTKKKIKSSSSTPKSKKKQIIRTKSRRHSVHQSSVNKNRINSRSPSLTRSKKKTIVIKKKTPSKRSPALTKSLKKKRERVRRATADPVDLSKHIDEASENSNIDENDDDGEESDHDIDIHDINDENRDYSNSQLNQNKFICEREPRSMTVRELQKWLNKYNISYNLKQYKYKQDYVELVENYRLLPLKKNDKKRCLSPNHKKRHSPHSKIAKVATKKHRKYSLDSPIASNNKAPLPKNIRSSPLTPQNNDNDDVKQNIKIQSRIRGISKVKGNGLLMTPTLNKKGIARIDTPTKMNMRDEIRTLLDYNEDILYPTTNNEDKKITSTGYTPKQNKYDEHELNKVLNDLRKEKKHKTKTFESPARISKIFDSRSRIEDHVDDVDVDDDDVISEMEKDLKYTKNHTQDEDNKEDNEYTLNQQRRGEKSLLSYNDNINDMDNNNPNQSIIRSTTKKQKKANRIRLPSPCSNDRTPSPVKQHNNDDKTSTPVMNDHPMSPAPNHTNYSHIQSPAINPSIPKILNKNVSPIKLPFQNQNQVKNQHQNENVNKKSSKLLFSSLILFGLIGACLSYFFMFFDGMNKINDFLIILNDLNNDSNDDLLFCDKGSNIISGFNDNDNILCIECPDNAKKCVSGIVYCPEGYLLQGGNKCDLNRGLVRFAYDINEQIIKILSERRGQYECGESLISSISMNEDELLSKIDIIDKKYLSESFEYFKEKILSDSSIISYQYKTNQYNSFKSIKSPFCRIKESARSNVLGLITTFIVIFIVFGIYYRYKQRKWNDLTVNNLIDQVYNILDENYRFNNQPIISVDAVKNRLKPKNKTIWNMVEKKLQKDSNIQKSMRMIDGMQKKCWKLSKTPIIQHQNIPNNNNNNNNKINNPYTQQNQWSPYTEQKNQTEQTKFPAYTKRDGRW